MIPLAAGVGGTGPDGTAVPSPLKLFADNRDAIVGDLAGQVAVASRRQDTRHPAFKGCVDWHSAVHGVWALLAYERATGDRQYQELVSSILNAEALSAERAHLARSPQFEMPYGRAWFLRLAIEHHKLAGPGDLLAFADEVARSMQAYYHGRRIDRFSGAYASDSWALINVLDYARHRHLAELEADVTGWVNARFVDAEPNCGYERERGNFMAIGTNVAALVSRVLAVQPYAAWLDHFIAVNGLPAPIVRAAGDHEFGLNFSRAWGLWDMYAQSGRTDVAEAYAAHLDRGLTPPGNWRGSYMAVGHWVAQFGIFAMQPLFGPEKGR